MQCLVFHGWGFETCEPWLDVAERVCLIFLIILFWRLEVQDEDVSRPGAWREPVRVGRRVVEGVGELPGDSFMQVRIPLV